VIFECKDGNYNPESDTELLNRNNINNNKLVCQNLQAKPC